MDGGLPNPTVNSIMQVDKLELTEEYDASEWGQDERAALSLSRSQMSVWSQGCVTHVEVLFFLEAKHSKKKKNLQALALAVFPSKHGGPRLSYLCPGTE